ncbi:hypothetical protein EMPG_10769 [Blastomyces silverae]|uniref:Uncharacterized protein n=1 Tax=Blastomyces silverae TaxID=2060906 RepID=A0A0H1B9A8_9EURO|nr:hypothetical protein EMPG_10769 [Blastomyces silverae]
MEEKANKISKRNILDEIEICESPTQIKTSTLTDTGQSKHDNAIVITQGKMTSSMPDQLYTNQCEMRGGV